MKRITEAFHSNVGGGQQSSTRLCCWALVAVAAAVGVEGFVNVPQVRKHTLQSTSTAVTYEPAFILTANFQRNPFADDEPKKEEEKVPSSAAAFDERLQKNSQGEAAAATVVVPLVEPSPAIHNIDNLLEGKIGTTIEGGVGGGASRLWRIARQCITSEQARRQAQNELRVALHHILRDSGTLRSIMDFLVTIGTPSLALDNPSIVPTFLQLTKECMHIPYGSHALQGIDMYLPKQEEAPKGMIFFVHGGAWGSGLPWMYRLCAQPFLEKGMAVAIVGYRTFPDGDIQDQVGDLEMASKELAHRYPDLCQQVTELGVVGMGHSSGAHILMQMVVNRLQRKIKKPTTSSGATSDTSTPKAAEMIMDAFVGLSAPYEIASHYEFETLRGVEEMSPMKAACGNDQERLSDYSPVLQLFQNLMQLPKAEQELANQHCPRMAMIHGIQDDTVPFTATQQAAKLLNLAGITKCDEMYLSDTGHSETIFEIMFGGKTQTAVMDWLDRKSVNTCA